MSKRQMTTQRPANQQNRAAAHRQAGQLMAQLSGYLASWQRGARVAAAALALGALAALGACGEEKVVRYRVTINLDVNGETKSGSGVIQTLFYGGGGASQPYKYYTQTQGVAAVVDLGRHGWLVATLTGTTDSRRKSGVTCKEPRSVEELLGAFGLDAAEVVKLRTGKRELLDGNLPAFVWFPRDQPYTAAEQICPEEFSKVIGADVHLKSGTIEIVPDASLKTVLDIDASWLHEIRVDRAPGKKDPLFMASRKDFIPGRLSIENPGVARP
jgi:hypothetical protein